MRKWHFIFYFIYNLKKTVYGYILYISISLSHFILFFIYFFLYGIVIYHSHKHPTNLSITWESNPLKQNFSSSRSIQQSQEGQSPFEYYSTFKSSPFLKKKKNTYSSRSSYPYLLFLQGWLVESYDIRSRILLLHESSALNLKV